MKATVVDIPIRSCISGNRSVTTAPTLPAAAPNPAPVARTRVGKTTARIRNVVDFGPTFWKKFEIAKPISASAT